MTAIALIKFNQADGSGSPAGEAHSAIFYFSPDTAKNQITITNGDNTDVASWKIELLYQPPGSALGAVPGTPVVLAQATSNTPSASFLMDVPDGCYRIRLTVWDSYGVANIDIRNVGVPNGRGFITPPYQKLPDPLPLPATGLSGNKPDELNFNGQVYGWLGDSNEGMHYDIFKLYDDLPLLLVATTPFTAKALQEPPYYLVNLTTIGGNAVYNLPTGGWRTGQRFRVQAYGSTSYTLTINAPAGHTINGSSSIVIRPYNIVVFVYLGGTEWALLGVPVDWDRTGTTIHPKVIGDTLAVGSAAMAGTEKLRAVGAIRCDTQLQVAGAVGDLGIYAYGDDYVGLTLDAYKSAVWPHALLNLWGGRGTKAAPSRLLMSDYLATISFRGYTSGGSHGTGAHISAIAEEDFAAGAFGTKLSFETVAIGAAVLVERFALDATAAAFSVPVSCPSLTVNGQPIEGYTLTPVKTGAYNAVIGNLVPVDPSSGGFEVTLPTAVGMGGRGVTVKNVTDSTNPVTFGTTGGQRIDGRASGVDSIAAVRAQVTFISDNSNWMRFPPA